MLKQFQFAEKADYSFCAHKSGNLVVVFHENRERLSAGPAGQNTVRGKKVTRKVCHGDELTEVSTGHLWEVTGHALKGGLPHFTLSCKHPGRTDTDVVLCESGLLMRFKRAAKSAPPVFSFDRLARLVRPLF